MFTVTGTFLEREVQGRCSAAEDLLRGLPDQEDETQSGRGLAVQREEHPRDHHRPRDLPDGPAGTGQPDKGKNRHNVSTCSPA